LHRAITEGWDVPPEVRTATIRRMAEIVDGGEDRDSIGASKVLLAATKLRLDEARLNLDEKVAEEVYEVNVYGNDRSDPERPDATPDKGLPGVEASPPGSSD
jgi:hypothetical protein